MFARGYPLVVLSAPRAMAGMAGVGAISVVDMHTGGEPLRIVVSGLPSLSGDTVLEKRAHFREHHDDLRRLLMAEPRGHRDMYGAVVLDGEFPGADHAVFFMHNEGYSSMCGHAVIALGKYFVDRASTAAATPPTPGAVVSLRIAVPCGIVHADVIIKHGGRAGSVSFVSVPAYVHASVSVDASILGTRRSVPVDVAYGGAFYAICDAKDAGVDVHTSAVADLVTASQQLCARVREVVPLSHPEPELAFLYGAIFTDGADAFSEAATTNVCVFAGDQVDRSPTGSGVTARVAVHAAKGLVRDGQVRTFRSVVGSTFTGAIASHCTAPGGGAAVTVRVQGEGFYCGEARFTLDDGDELGRGFLVRP